MKIVIFVAAVIGAIVSSLSTYSLLMWTQNSRENVGRFSKIQIVDSKGKTRAFLGTINIGGQSVPQLIFSNENGQPVIALRIDERGNGSLFFNSNNKEGRVSVGYLRGSDVVTPSGAQITDAEDSTGAWGMQVLGPDHRSTSLGMFSNGHSFGSETGCSPKTKEASDSLRTPQ